MAVISGKNGTISFGGSSVADCTGWSITTTSNNPAYGSCDTAGWKKRVAGIKDSSGNFTAKYNGAIAIAAGDTGSGVFTIDGSATYTVPIIVDQVQLEVDMDEGDTVGYSIDWSGNGAVVIS